MTRLELIPEVHDQAVRLGRHIEHDIRSWEHSVLSTWQDHFKARLLPTSVTWQRFSPILDQGHLGSCTGNAMAGALGCAPFVHNVPDAAQYNEDFAVKLYSKATVLDGFPGDYPPTDTGSSGLAVAKAAQFYGCITKYQHAFTLTGLIYALRSGPVIVGVPWFETMFHPDVNGMVVVGGKIVGGHEFLVRGYDKGVFLADNSWGTGWGVNGSFRFTSATWNTLRANGADITVPQK